MSKLGEKVAYLKGLTEGMRLDAQSDQGKLVFAVIDALETFASESDQVQEQISELREYVEDIDSDVSDLEEALFSEDEDEEEDDEEDEEDEDEDGDGLIEYECPHCGTVIFFDEEAFDMEEEHLCPNCHRSVFEDEDDGGDQDDDGGDTDDGE